MYRALLLTLFLPLLLKAQPRFDFQELSKKYTDQTVVILNRSQHMKLQVVKDKIRATSDNTEQMLHINNKNVGYTERRVGYVPGYYDITYLNATTYVPEEKGKMLKVKVDNFTDEDNISGSAFYDGVMFRKFQFPSLSVGAVTEYQYGYNYLEPDFLGGFYFCYGVPHVSVSYTVTFSDDVKIGYRFFGDSSNIRKTVYREGKNTVIKWEATHMPGLKRYDDGVDERFYEPHVFIYIESYKTRNGWVDMFGSVAKLYRHDYRHIAHVNKGKPEPGLQKTIDSLRSVSATDADMLRNTYYWVQHSMKYIAIENGAGGHVPREANDVYIKKFGDCKDFAGLITFILQNVGIPARLAWIGTRELPYTFEQLPLGYTSNHMIAAFHNGKEWIFIDGTDKHVPYGVPSSFTQGKEALISINEDSFVVATVPVMPPRYSFSSDSVYFRIAHDSIRGTGTCTIFGYKRTNLTARLYYAGIDKTQEILKNSMSLGNNRCEVENVSCTGLNSNDSPLVVNYTFNIPAYVRKIDDELYINMHLRKFFTEKIDTSKGRTVPKESDFAYAQEAKFILEIPDGYKVKTLPKPFQYTDDDFSFRIEYVVSGKTIVLFHQSSYNKLILPASRFDNWNKRIDDILRVYKDQIVLTKSIK